jgi:hypothetical protein
MHPQLGRSNPAVECDSAVGMVRAAIGGSRSRRWSFIVHNHRTHDLCVPFRLSVGRSTNAGRPEHFDTGSLLRTVTARTAAATTRRSRSFYRCDHSSLTDVLSHAES